MSLKIPSILLLFIAPALACSLQTQPSSLSINPQTIIVGETGRVMRVIDGDTIEVNINGQTVDVRYLQMNTTERGEPCYQEGKDANATLVDGKVVTLIADAEATDQYGRWLRHVYVNNLHVNAELVRNGWAEAVVYEPNDQYWEAFILLEQEATRAKRGCHGLTTLFEDNSYRR